MHRIHRILSQGQSARGEEHSFYHDNAKFRVILFIFDEIKQIRKIRPNITISATNFER